jgi:hypothetical protein
MSTPTFGFDFSQMNPYITGIMDRSMRAADYRLSQMPVEDNLNRRAYAEWLNNNASKRGIAEQDANMRKRGFEAEQALQAEARKRAEQEKYVADQEKLKAYLASQGAAQQQPDFASGGGMRGAGVKRDFYTYGPYAFGGRGGGGSSSGASTAPSGFATPEPWKPPTYTKKNSYVEPSYG